MIRILGICILVIYSIPFIISMSKANPGGAMFVMGIWYGLVLIFLEKFKKIILLKKDKYLFKYGLLIFISGMIIELIAYITSIPQIQKTGTAYLFSTNLSLDLLIGLPHYAAVGFTWAWVIRRFTLSAIQQLPLIVIFWGLSLDEFIHLQALLRGNVLDFLAAGLFVVYAFNWPLVVMQEKFKEEYPNRINSWVKFPIAFFVQILPIIVLIITKKLIVG